MKKLLFVTWDGEAQSYLTSLFFPIFRHLRELDIDVHVLQFSFAADEAIERTRASADRHGLTYMHRRTPARFRTPLIPAIACWGAAECALYARKHAIDGYMPRSLVPAAMVLMAQRLGRELPVVFDADGLMADERVDFAGWNPKAAPYRALRAVEKSLIESSESVIVRTENARSILASRVAPAKAESVRRKTFVIPNLKDEREFQPGTESDRHIARQRLGVGQHSLLITSVGSLAQQYYPTQQAQVFKHLLDDGQDAYWLILTGHEAVAREVAQNLGIPESRVMIDRVAASEIPALVAAADVGLALRQPSFSQRAVCPIKLGEYLLCGTPVVATRGVGDVESYIDRSCGLLLDDVSTAELKQASQWIVREAKANREAMRASARRRGLEIFAMSNLKSLYRPVFAGIDEDE